MTLIIYWLWFITIRDNDVLHDNKVGKGCVHTDATPRLSDPGCMSHPEGRDDIWVAITLFACTSSVKNQYLIWQLMHKQDGP